MEEKQLVDPRLQKIMRLFGIEQANKDKDHEVEKDDKSLMGG